MDEFQQAVNRLINACLLAAVESQAFDNVRRAENELLALYKKQLG